MKANHAGVWILSATLLSACSPSTTTFTATSTLEGGDGGMKVTMTLDGFSPKNEDGGDGTLTIVKTPGRQLATPEGIYSVKWKWQKNGDTFYVSIPAAHAGLEFRPSLLDTMNQSRSASIFWCFACERNMIGVGDLIWIPGVFSKTS